MNTITLINGTFIVTKIKFSSFTVNNEMVHETFIKHLQRLKTSVQLSDEQWTSAKKLLIKHFIAC